MSLSAEQQAQLKAPLSSANVKKNPRGFDYVEAWHAIAEANRIFGFDGWTRETVDLRQLGEPRVVNNNTRVGYMAKVRITVGDVVREGCGFGQGINSDVDMAHESALKEAESDAMKRALMTFGNPFGLALYDKAKANVEDPEAPPKRLSAAELKRNGEDAKIKGDINQCNLAGLLEWETHFTEWTAHLPQSWHDPIRDMIALRREELLAGPAAGEAEMDEAFRATMGRPVSAPVAGTNGRSTVNA